MSDREKLKKLNRNNYNNIPNVKEEEKRSQDHQISSVHTDMDKNYTVEAANYISIYRTIILK